jgi:hypothetical protein
VLVLIHANLYELTSDIILIILGIDIVPWTFLNPKGHQNTISGSKVAVILQKGRSLPIGGVAWEGSAAQQAGFLEN